ncbi:MAG: TPM domain-containing protein, partial [Vitreimonas sp.]
MTGRLAALVIAVLATLWAAAYAAPVFPALSGRVVDEAGVLSPHAETRLTQRLAALEESTGRQVVVVTLRSLQGYEIEDYGYQLGRAWGIGRAAEDDGVLLIVAPNERRVRIEVGYGLEPVLTDALSSAILNRRVLPRFRAGDMEGGVVAGADAIIEQLALPADEAQARAAEAQQEEAAGGGGFGLMQIILLFVFLLILSSLLGGGRR